MIKNETCSADFLKNNQMSNFTKILLVGAELFYADGRTDGKRQDEATSCLS